MEQLESDYESEDPGIVILFASEADIHNILSFRSVANIQPALQRGKKVYIYIYSINTTNNCM